MTRFFRVCLVGSALAAGLLAPAPARSQDELPVHSASVAQAQRDAKYVTRHEVNEMGYELIEESLRASCRRRGGVRRFRCRVSFEMGDTVYRATGWIRNDRKARIRYDLRVNGTCVSDSCRDQQGKVTTRWRWRGAVTAPLV